MKTKITPTKDDLIDVVLWAIIATFLLVLMFKCTPARCQEAQSIHLKKGWQLVSSYVIPYESNIDSLFKGQPVDVIVSIGGVYWPDHGVNTIGNWNYKQAYKVKMKEATTVTFTGDYTGWTCIDYNTGVQLIPVTCDHDLTPEIYYRNHTGDFILMIDVETLGIYYPVYGVNTIGQMKPGKGYLILNTNNFTICQQ